MATLHQGITRRQYLELKSEDGGELENQSKAKAGIKSAWHYYKAHMDPERPRDDPSDHMIKGTLIHSLGIEGREDFMVFDGYKRGKKWEDFKVKADNLGMIPVSSESGTLNAKDIRGAAASLREAMAELGADSDSECAITFEQHGVECKALIDQMSVDVRVFDAKATAMIEESQFERHAFQMGWDFQQAWYSEAVRQVFDVQPQFIFVCVEPTYPYDWAIYTLHGDAVDLAKQRVERALNNIRVARETGDWSHKKREIKIVTPPLYLMDIDNE